MRNIFVCDIVILLLLTVGLSAKEKKIDFDKDIQPILSDKCFHCHGPDAKKREAKLRLDTFEAAIAKRKKGAAIIPGNAMGSAIIKRMITDDQDDIMPPPDSNRHVSKAQIELIKQWIKEGATYSEHWAFVKAKSPKVPVDGKDWARNPIDNFIYKNLIELKLKPNAEADKRTLLRRLSLDLTGLPPTPEEMAMFLTDKDPQAYEKQVDRLLNSPHYGERMAWPWLDAARYADTNGYQGDAARTMWPWRDWVVKAFNKNMPFDQFTIEQVAGDMLPNATSEQKLATAFLRNHMINGEGGRIAEENRVEYIFDQLETVGTTFLGLTLNCCRCHDHKFDPISQKDYFSFSAFFNQTPINGSGGSGQTAPTIIIPPAQEILTKQQNILKTKQDKLDALTKVLIDEFGSLAKAKSNDIKWALLKPLKAFAQHQTLVIGKNFSILAKGENPNNDNYTIIAKAPKKVSALKLSGLRHESMTGGGISRSNSGNFVLTEIKINLIREGQRIPVKIHEAQASYEQTGFKINQAFDNKKSTGWAVWNGKPFTQDHHAVFVLDKTFLFNQGDQLEIGLEHDSKHARHNLGHFSIATIGEIPVAGIAQLFKDHKVKINSKDDFLKKNKEFQKLQKNVQNQKKAINALGIKVMVMQDNQTRKTYILNTGLYNQREAEVTANTPESLFHLPKGVKADRLALANWLVSKENPLTSRVIINRFWAQVFGTGLTKTTENFGIQGERPKNPELLDWLSSKFIDSKWNVKNMIRLMVTSTTYRQSTNFTDKKIETDPYNRFLARGPRYRMPSWMIRDQSLAASGLLNEEMGGKGVLPYQPAGVWAEMTFGKIRYKQDNGNKLYRRSIYTFWRRIVSPTMFFDIASRQFCEVKDKRTNTPLHALVTMNDTTYVEAGRALAVRVIGEKSNAAKIQKIYSLLLGRNANEQEIKILQNKLQKITGKYKENPKLADEYLNVGEYITPENSNKIEVASLANLALMILNLDESLTKE